ncbi:hypothetical protein KUTeg_006448 [Tegillarca granosa]|uniref:Palmitoyltransferase n=1 Tax=Tegillarca granosa TaxID=220873 RepID=A0ABQ9FGJ3_TEGGR|nr:hypothetical protein KUTeg_006448 [Tegillarca granosa]
MEPGHGNADELSNVQALIGTILYINVMTDSCRTDTSRGISGEEPLCCCEYENIKGERSHILACFCDCEALDEASDACLTCRRITPGTQNKIHDDIADRCRIPGFCGQGAVKLPLDVVTPVIVIPVCLCMATMGPVMTVFVMLVMPIFMLFFYKAWRLNHKTRTKFFFAWGVTSCVLMFLVFQIFVIAYREVLLWENLLLTTSGFVMFYYMYKTRSNQSFIRSSKKIPINSKKKIQNKKSEEPGSEEIDQKNNIVKYTTSLEEMTAPAIPLEDVPWIDSRPIKDGKIITWCNVCEVQRPPRSGHCNVCESCVPVRDHHCVWIDCCVGASNHRPFIVSMFLFVFCGFYGFHLTMTTICTPEMYLDYFLLPNDCRFIYGDFAQNITSQEYHAASKRGYLWWGLFAKNNIHNHGVIRNWKDFLYTSRKGQVEMDK